MRLRVLLTVLLGGIAPLALWGWWTLATMRDTGEELLRSRMEVSLDEATREIGLRWITVRSALTDVAESPAVRSAVAGAGIADGADFRSALEPTLASGLLRGKVHRIVAFDRTGARRLDVRLPLAPGVSPGLLPPLRRPVHEADGRLVGGVEVTLASELLLPSRLRVGGSRGTVLAVAGVDETAPSLLPRPPATESEGVGRFLLGGEAWISMRRELRDPELAVIVEGPLAPFEEPLHQARRQALLGLALALGVGAVVALLLARAIVSPLRELAVTVDRVAGGAFDVEVRPRGPGEVARVGRAFNQMTRGLRRTLDRLARQERLAAVGRFAASLAHEIRNPLTAVRLDLERAVEAMDDPRRASVLVQRALHEIDRLDRTVGGTLRVARGDVSAAGFVDLEALITSATERVRSRFAARGVRLEDIEVRNDGGSRRVPGDAAVLERVVLNLLENAADACEAGGRVGVRLRTTAEGGVVEVWDSGRGMRPEELARAGEILYTTRPDGTGVGLHWARRVVEAHGGRLRLRSEEGSGTVVRFELPSPRLGSSRNGTEPAARDDA
ncbi:MAG: HAMP domain-containing sensor histidine kinase [Longimicrobiales bacterium]